MNELNNRQKTTNYSATGFFCSSTGGRLEISDIHLTILRFDELHPLSGLHVRTLWKAMAELNHGYMWKIILKLFQRYYVICDHAWNWNKIAFSQWKSYEIISKVNMLEKSRAIQ